MIQFIPTEIFPIIIGILAAQVSASELVEAIEELAIHFSQF